MSKLSISLFAGLLMLGMFISDAGVTTPASAAEPPNRVVSSFRFASIGDTQAEVDRFSSVANQLAPLNPALVIFNGDLEQDGFALSEINPMITVLKSAGLFDKTFMVRGNHDDHVADSAALWEAYFETAPNIRVWPVGVTNYVALHSDSDNLTYSFNYGNSIFIGLDIPENTTNSTLTPILLNFIDSRLTYAEGQSLTHAFIFFHGPAYCVESTHCECSSKDDASCTPSSWVSLINKHPIVSAAFHGHEHILGWTHMDNSRVAGLTRSYEQFLTSPSGGWQFNDYLYPARVDYADMGKEPAFATIDVSGLSFTFSMYRAGNPQPVWSHTFTKIPPATKTFTSLSTGGYDGWILESGENANVGGTLNATATTLRLGDDVTKKQYRSILSFSTGSLPDNAVITKVTLRIKQQAIVGGGNPVTIFQGFMADIKRGIFGTVVLQAADWQTVAQKTAGPFSPSLGGGWYTLNLTSAKAYVNKLATAGGLTQIRLRFKLDDNNNAIANYLSLYSGNAGAASRPQLIIEYYVP